MTDTPRPALYESRIQKLTLEVEALAARSARIGNLRGISFLVALGSLIWGAIAHGGTPSIVSGVLGIGAFAWLVRAHNVLSTDEAYAQRLLAPITARSSASPATHASCPTTAPT